MVTIRATIPEAPQLSAQMDEGITLEAHILTEDVKASAKIMERAKVSAVVTTILLCALLPSTIDLSAEFLPDDWMDGYPGNFITADGYLIETADGAIFCVQEE